MWAGESTQVSEDENYVMKLQGEVQSSNSIKKIKNFHLRPSEISGRKWTWKSHRILRVDVSKLTEEINCGGVIIVLWKGSLITMVMIRKHSKARSLIATRICGKDFMKKSSQHRIIHSGEHTFDENDKCFNLGSNLELHQQLYLGEKPHICSECGKGIRYSSVLCTHQNVRRGKMQ